MEEITLRGRNLGPRLVGVAYVALVASVARAQHRPSALWHLTPVASEFRTKAISLGADSLTGVHRRDVPLSTPTRATIRPYLLTGLIVGAAAGSIAVAQRARRRCQDCWLPALEIPLFVGGGALVGYGVGGLVFVFARSPGRSASP